MVRLLLIGFCLFWVSPAFSADSPQQLPGTTPLTVEGDLADQRGSRVDEGPRVHGGGMRAVAIEHRRGA